MGKQITRRPCQEWNNRAIRVCGAESVEKVSSSTWKVSDCSTGGRAGGLTCPHQAKGTTEAKAWMQQFGCLGNKGVCSVSWMRREGRVAYTRLRCHSKWKSQQGEGLPQFFCLNLDDHTPPTGPPLGQRSYAL